MNIVEVEAKLLALVLDLIDLALRPTDQLSSCGLNDCDLQLLQRALSDFFDVEIDWSGTSIDDSVHTLAAHACTKLGEHFEVE